jgi:hypothetical protein
MIVSLRKYLGARNYTSIPIYRSLNFANFTVYPFYPISYIFDKLLENLLYTFLTDENVMVLLIMGDCYI